MMNEQILQKVELYRNNWRRNYMIVKNIVDLIGNTPMVEVNSLNPNPKVKMYLKLEKFNPG